MTDEKHVWFIIFESAETSQIIRTSSLQKVKIKCCTVSGFDVLENMQIEARKQHSELMILLNKIM